MAAVGELVRSTLGHARSGRRRAAPDNPIAAVAIVVGSIGRDWPAGAVGTRRYAPSARAAPPQARQRRLTVSGQEYGGLMTHQVAQRDRLARLSGAGVSIWR